MAVRVFAGSTCMDETKTVQDTPHCTLTLPNSQFWINQDLEAGLTDFTDTELLTNQTRQFFRSALYFLSYITLTEMNWHLEINHMDSQNGEKVDGILAKSDKTKKLWKLTMHPCTILGHFRIRAISLFARPEVSLEILQAGLWLYKGSSCTERTERALPCPCSEICSRVQWREG